MISKHQGGPLVLSMLAGFSTILNTGGSNGKIYLKACRHTLFSTPRTLLKCSKARVTKVEVVINLGAAAMVVAGGVVAASLMRKQTLAKIVSRYASLTMGFGLVVVAPMSTPTTGSVRMSIFAPAALRKMVPRKVIRLITASLMESQVRMVMALALVLSSLLSLLVSNYSILSVV